MKNSKYLLCLTVTNNLNINIIYIQKEKMDIWGYLMYNCRYFHDNTYLGLKLMSFIKQEFIIGTILIE